MMDMGGTLRFLCLFLVSISLANGQSTTSQPQGHCANYLNRYTNENQCVYSFIVPKTDRDRCQGLGADLTELQRQVQAMRTRQDNTEEQIRSLRQENERNRNLQTIQNQLALARQQKATLEQQKTELQNRNNILETERIGLVRIQDQFHPLQSNHTQLRRDFAAIQQQLRHLQGQHEILTANYTKLERTKNCSDVNKHLPSCAVIRQWGYTESGHAMIDPDGQGGVKPFMVYCDMHSDPSTGITVVENELQPNMTIQGCNGQGCLSVDVTYKGASMEQIEALMSISIACEQKIRYDCQDSKLLKEGTAWWESRTGQRMNYWGGAAPGSGKCACGMDGSCYDRGEVCNCDADTETWLYDEGHLRKKSELPVTSLKFGDVATNQGEMGRLTLGALKCKWNVNMSVASCSALRRAGVEVSGVYSVDPDGPKGPIVARNVLCQLPAYRGDFFNASTDVGSPITVHSNDPNLYVFTSCGKLTGHSGPTSQQCNTTYAGSNVHVRVEQGMQLWRVPRNGRYRITIKAPGGYHSEPARAARGATASGEVHLRGAVQLKLLVGQKGKRFGGSGGTFVIKMDGEYTERPLIIAGGAGGSAGPHGAVQYTTTDASLSPNGKDGYQSTANVGNGGTNGNGGNRGYRLTGNNVPGGGAGFRGDGVKSSDNRFEPRPTAAVAVKRNNQENVNPPGSGGTYNYNGVPYDGGFGGGGSGARNAPGGAGGYSGGGGANLDGHSGGGGSFKDGERVGNYRIEANNIGAGEVRIEYLGESLIINQEIRDEQTS